MIYGGEKKFSLFPYLSWYDCDYNIILFYSQTELVLNANWTLRRERINV